MSTTVTHNLATFFLQQLHHHWESNAVHEANRVAFPVVATRLQRVGHVLSHYALNCNDSNPEHAYSSKRVSTHAQRLLDLCCQKVSGSWSGTSSRHEEVPDQLLNLQVCSKWHDGRIGLENCHKNITSKHDPASQGAEPRDICGSAP